jgi:Ca2+-transporting ATPase
VATSVLCNDARVQEGEFLGEGTEVALFKLAAACGLPPEEIVSAYPRLEEIPFESERKMMSTIHRLPGGKDSPFSFLETETVLLSKGAPEVILARCTHLFSREGVRPMSPEEKRALEGEAGDMARRALRTLAFACRPLDDLPAAGGLEELEEGLVYLGMAGMMDPPRPEAYAALEKCRRAHIEVVMITGDHAATAAAVAEELSILTPEKELVTGEELARMSDVELAERVESIAVYARVSPADKVKIVKAWKSKGKTVAMTGDGVNDAPALKNADIGVAMGVAGTDVSKEASDMVLADDNFATIVAAVEEGRVIYDNLKKFIYFLLSCNMSEVSTMFVGMLFAGITPLRAVQVLWMNLVTDGFPAMALGVDTPSPDVMYRPPRDPFEGILSPRKQFHVVWQGFVLSLGALASFFISYYVVFPGHPAMIQTTVFTTLVLSQLLHTYNSRSETLSFTEMPFLDNRALLAALGGSLFLQLAVVLLPPFMHVFGTEYIGAAGWGLVLSCSVLPVVLIDRIKVLTRRRRAA